jgi:hypothetical protein
LIFKLQFRSLQRYEINSEIQHHPMEGSSLFHHSIDQSLKEPIGHIYQYLECFDVDVTNPRVGDFLNVEFEVVDEHFNCEVVLD